MSGGLVRSEYLAATDDISDSDFAIVSAPDASWLVVARDGIISGHQVVKRQPHFHLRCGRNAGDSRQTPARLLTSR